MSLDGPLIDALLEHGITDKQLTLLKNLDAVEYLLETLHHEYEGECIACGGGRGIYRESHLRDCKVMLARIAVGQHTLEAELEAAENEARRENERRSAPRRPASTVEQMNITLRSLFSPERINEALRAPAADLPSLQEHEPDAAAERADADVRRLPANVVGREVRVVKEPRKYNAMTVAQHERVLDVLDDLCDVRESIRTLRKCGDFDGPLEGQVGVLSDVLEGQIEAMFKSLEKWRSDHSVEERP